VIVADTHAWVWWAADNHLLSRPARRALITTGTVGIAAITLWEIAMLVEKKRLALDREVLSWLQDAISKTRVVVLPLTPQVAVSATTIPHFRDPSDRLIAATALTHGVPLVTKDERIQRSGVVATIW
jgi:PIN domain nuclease of toxin-antitoxin system